jgi:hypothetical protein
MFTPLALIAVDAELGRSIGGPALSEVQGLTPRSLLLTYYSSLHAFCPPAYGSLLSYFI